MLSDIAEAMSDSKFYSPSLVDGNPSFSEYISRCRDYISKTRTDLNASNRDLIINANTPFELKPTTPVKPGQKHPVGVLLVHGLLDSPFSLHEIGERLQQNGIFTRAILLPGHGTVPEDLNTVAYQDWITTVRYGIESINKEVDKLYVVGYSTGATVATYLALTNAKIDGLVLLSPAVRIKAPVHLVVAWHGLLKTFSKTKRDWVYWENECDYVKYRSVGFNGYHQVQKLTNAILNLTDKKPLTTPIYMMMSYEDETVSATGALEYFFKLRHPNNRFLLYSAKKQKFHDARIEVRNASYPSLQIEHLSHVSLPFSAQNFHYGQEGDFCFSSHLNNAYYGAYNRIESNFSTRLYQLGLIKHPRKELTYNPDFDHLAQRISEFVLA